jgi:hypothetical protein
VSADLQAARRKLTEKVMGRPGVAGTAVSERGGKPCLVVYLKDAKGAEGIPRAVDGFRVVTEKTGGFGPL